MKNQWNYSIKLKAALGMFENEAESISLDIQQFLDEEVQHQSTSAQRIVCCFFFKM